MKIDRNMAKKIIDNTMNVLGNNINIMNRDGIIIGSGARERINTYHEIAARVVEFGEAIIIEKDEITKYQGVKPGINLPITFQGKIVGVVGITGDVEEVAGYGEIVKNMVELILQQEFLRHEIEIENKARENFFQQLINNDIKDDELLKDRANLLSVATNIFRVVYYFKIESFDSKAVNHEVKIINNSILINDEDIFLNRGENVVLIKTLESDPADHDEEIKRTARKIFNKFKKKLAPPEVGIGQIFKDLKKLHLSYKGAKQALNIGIKVNNKNGRSIYYINNLGIDYFLPFISLSSVNYYLNHLVKSDKEDIIKIFSEENIGYIVEELVKNNINISKTAEKLFIHRNTLLYRLKKIEKLTGFNPKNAKDLFELYWAYHLYLYYLIDG